MTTIKRVYDRKEDIPAEFTGNYEENGEAKWVLKFDVEGLVPAKRVDEFRTTNVQLRERLEAYGDKDHGGEETPEHVAELRQQVKDIDAGTLVKAGEINKKVEERTKEARDDFQKKEKKLSEKLQAATRRLERSLIEAKALEAGAQFGLRKSAAEDLVDRVLKIFKVKFDETTGEPSVLSYEQDGNTIRRGADDQPLRIADYVKKLATDKENGAVHLFEGNRGMDIDPNRRGQRGGDDSGPNPWDKDGGHFNRTRQGEIIRDDPEKAIRMAAKFGHKLEVGEATRAAATAGRA
jgi:hypothetical protein